MYSQRIYFNKIILKKAQMFYYKIFLKVKKLSFV